MSNKAVTFSLQLTWLSPPGGKTMTTTIWQQKTAKKKKEKQRKQKIQRSASCAPDHRQEIAPSVLIGSRLGKTSAQQLEKRKTRKKIKSAPKIQLGKKVTVGVQNCTF